MGTMGSGKTTAARLIAEHFKFHLVEENFGENAFLPRFYKKMNRWAFHSQTFFLMEKINQLMEIGAERKKKSIVQDTPVEQDVFSYAKAQHALGNMDDAEWKLYHKIYASFAPHLPKPDAIIFLDTSIGEIEKRISSRGRAYEKKIPTKYLELLDKLNRDWLRENKKVKIISIPTDGLNIVTSKTAQQQMIATVKNALHI
jgi:deoxyadenosine/deoxycytidine kinase